MTLGDWRNWSALIDYAMNNFQIPGGGIATRFGNLSYSAGSISHLHTNIMVPDKTENVRVTLCKDVESQLQNEKRLAIFEKLRQAGVTASEAKEKAVDVLSEEEYKFVADKLK